MNKDMLVNYNVIIFDCDGVILDVNNLKSDAFGKVVSHYPDSVVEKFVEHCRNTFGVSRYVKFEEFFTLFAKESYNEKLYRKFLKDYAQLCQEIYTNANMTLGAFELLTQLNLLNKKLYVASGSDEKELNNAFAEKDLKKYFSEIYGSPKTKLECVNKILQDYDKSEVVFIGDAISDMKAANSVGIDFIYVTEYSVQSSAQDTDCRDGAKKVVKNLQELISN